MSNSNNKAKGGAAGRYRRQRTDTQRKMVIEFFQQTASTRDIEVAFNEFVAPSLRHMLYGDTPGHDEQGNRL